MMGDKNKFGQTGGSNENVVDLNQSRRRRESSIQEKEQWIGKQLQQVYAAALRDPIPNNLLDLLKKLDNDDPHSP